MSSTPQGRITLVTAAAVPPVSLDDAKRHCRVVDSADDLYISGLIALARTYLERVYGVYAISTTVDVTYDGTPAWTGAVPLPCAPVASITSITTYDTADASSSVASSVYRLDSTVTPPRLVLKADQAWPTGLRPYGGYVVRCVAGYGATAATIPQPITHALLMLVAHWYEQREVTRDPGAQATNPLGFETLIAQYRVGDGLA